MKRATCVVAAILTTISAPRQAIGSPFSLSSDEFPIVMYAVNTSVNRREALAAAGVDYIHSYGMGTSTNQDALDADRQFLDSAEATGQKVMVHLRAEAWLEKTNGVEQLRKYVQEFTNHPALGFWYLIDEPDNKGITASALMPYYQVVTNESPGVPVSICHAWTEHWYTYGSVQDILMNDGYPVGTNAFPHANLDTATIFTASCLKGARPVIPVLQCWRKPGEGMRYPNRAELRYWSYACLAMGTRGLAWYSYYQALHGANSDDGEWLDGTFLPMISNVWQFAEAVTPAHVPERLRASDGSCFLAVWERGSNTWVVLVNNQPTARTATLWMDRRIAAADLSPSEGTREVNAQIRDGSLQSIPLEPWESFVWQATALAVPTAPTNVQATAQSAGRINLTWSDTATNETAFTIDRQAQGNTTWLFLGETPANSTTYRDVAGLDPDNTYTYRVKAYNALGNGLYGETSARTLTGMDVRLAAGNDDAEENAATGVVVLDSSDLDLVNDGGADQILGIRFPGLRIPHGATIHAAHLQFTVAETSSVPTSLIVQGQAIDDAPAFTNSTHNISARATTGVSVSWTPAAWNTQGACGPDQRTPDLAAILQAIVDRPGWTIGNALALIVSGTGRRVAESGNNATDAAPFLHIHCSTARLDLQPGSDDDDAEESVASGSMFLSGNLELVNDGGTDQLVGLRFPDISIPQGAAIQTAHLQFTAAETSSVPTSLTLRGQEIDDAPAFTSSTFNISARSKTSAFVAWAPAAWNQVGQRYADQRTPDLAEIIQAIVDRSGWTSGNALALIINGTGTRTATSATNAAPQLHIRYHCTAQSFVAYNDLAWFAGQLSSGITRFTTTNNFPSGNPEGVLRDYETDQPLPIRVTVQGGESPQEDQGLHPSPNTDAHTVFNGKVNCAGIIGYDTANLMLTLTGLSPEKSYEFALYGDRNGSGYTGGAARYQHATLSGADSFANSSTPGTTLLTNSVPNDTTLYNAGYNNLYGFVTRFTQIDPGADGKIVVTVARDTDLSYYTYANAFMLAGHDTVKVGKDATWKYRKGTAEASEPPTEWRTPAFDDTAWDSGAAPFGYGDGPYATTLDDMKGTYLSVFLRAPFVIEAPTRVSRVEIQTLVDDGAIAWINGVEIGRSNVAGTPGTFVPCDTPTPTWIDPAFEWTVVLEGRTLPPLIAGTNILALQVFNSGINGSDCTLDCRLTVAAEVRVLQDADGDGMSDPWETDSFGGTSVSNAGTEQDFDLDGLLNIEEFIAGTHPTNATEWFDIDVSLSDDTVVVSLDGVETGVDHQGLNRFYAIEQRSTLNDDRLWEPATGYGAVPAINGTIAYTNSSEDALTLYRGRVWLQTE